MEKDEVITKSGLRLHLAEDNSNKTLCGHEVYSRRDGLQWGDPNIRNRKLCQICINKSGVGSS